MEHDVVTKEKGKIKVKEPKKYSVIMQNVKYIMIF